MLCFNEAEMAKIKVFTSLFCKALFSSFSTIWTRLLTSFVSSWSETDFCKSFSKPEIFVCSSNFCRTSSCCFSKASPSSYIKEEELLHDVSTLDILSCIGFSKIKTYKIYENFLLLKLLKQLTFSLFAFQEKRN